MSQDSALRSYYLNKIEQLEHKLNEKTQNVKRLEAQRNDWNNQVRVLRDELTALYESGSYVGEVVKQMGKNKVLVKVINQKYFLNYPLLADTFPPILALLPFMCSFFIKR